MKSHTMTYHDRKRAFTVFELLVVVAVVAVLLAIAVATVGRSRRRAAEIKSLANLRVICQTFELYTGKYSTYPWGRGGWGCPPTLAEPPWGVSFEIWSLDGYWPVLFHEDAPWPSNYPAWLSPGADARRITDVWERPGGVGFSSSLISSYKYSNSFVAEPSTWAISSSPVARPGSIRPDQVLFPSSKALLYDVERAYLRRPKLLDPRPIGFADGSALLRLDKEASMPVQNPDTPGVRELYRDTPDGVRGRDF